MPGTWTRESISGHPCDVYAPPRANPYGFVVLYLHGLHLTPLSDKRPFMEQFDKHGLSVVCPHTQRSWWTDKICREFDEKITAQQHVLQSVLPFIERRFGARPPQIGLLG